MNEMILMITQAKACKAIGQLLSVDAHNQVLVLNIAF
eukprot:COSAG06_NODE_253_length_19061_cov_33.083114_4_plen_37_part_00